jgi:hypothetical protein
MIEIEPPLFVLIATVVMPECLSTRMETVTGAI